MRGHEALIVLRRQGWRPAGGVIVDASPSGVDRWARDWPRMGMSMAFVDIEPGDPVHDLRFAIGLTVQVIGNDVRRVGEVAQAFVAAGAATVIAGAGDGPGETSAVFAYGNQECLQWPM